MKRIFPFIASLILTLFSLSAQLHLDVAPYLWYDSFTAENDEYHPTVQQLYDWYDRPSLAVLSLLLEKGGLKAYSQIELRSDMMADLVRPAWTNMQLLYDGEIFLDPNFPRVAYLEYSSDAVLASLGRRKISWGPGRDGLGISGMAPDFDHLFFDFSVPVDKGTWNYSYLIITTDRLGTEEMSEAGAGDYKTLIAHRFSYRRSRITFSLMDYNLVWGRVPDLQEASPLLHYHGLYQSEQNVMAGLALDVLLNHANRVYLECVIDDYNLSFEPEYGNPGAMGVLLGWQYRITDGRPCPTDKNSADFHSIRTGSLLKEGGLQLQWEQVWTSRYIYNREEEAGKFTNPRYFVWREEAESVNTFFGAAYGPDRLVERLFLSYDQHPLQAQLLFEYQLTGGSGIDGPYEYPYGKWLELGSPLSRQFRTALFYRWHYSAGSSLFGMLSVDYGKTGLFQCGLGWHKALF